MMVNKRKHFIVNHGRYKIDDLYLENQKQFNLEMVRWLCKNKKLNQYSRFFKTRIASTNNLGYPARNFLKTIFERDIIIDKSYDKEISDFFDDLASKQEPLGEEFEKVLYENLWDLYIRN